MRIERTPLCVLFGFHVRQLDNMNLKLAWESQSQLEQFRIRIEDFDTFGDFLKFGR